MEKYTYIWNTRVEFEVPTAVVMESPIFWDIPSHSPLIVNRRFGETCRLHLQGIRISQARNQREAGSKIFRSLPAASLWFLAWLILRP
jgi:hypothetical protein